jgi:16S rRNA (uracil1498-N3)-methyltransferase
MDLRHVRGVLMEVFYAPPAARSGDEIIISGDELHHLAHVLRRREGDELFVVNGLGILYRTVVFHVAKQEARCRIVEATPNYHERRQPLVLVQALLKQPAKMDWIVEKATELGVTRLLPVITGRTLVTRGHEDRWRRIALAAMKQSLRSFLPVIEAVRSFPEALDAFAGYSLILCHEQVDTTVTIDGLPSCSDQPAAVIIGPEGGFTEEEVELARCAHAHIVSLGERRLRSETAAIVALSRMSG